MTTFRIRGRIAASIGGALVGLVALAATAAAAGGMTEVATAPVQGNGFFGVDTVTRLRLIENGQTVARVTDGDCNNPAATAIVFDGQLEPAEVGDGSWAGRLYPASAAAEDLAAQGDTEGQVALLPAGDGETRVSAYLQGMPEGRTFHVCLGASIA